MEEEEEEGLYLTSEMLEMHRKRYEFAEKKEVSSISHTKNQGFYFSLPSFLFLILLFPRPSSSSSPHLFTLLPPPPSPPHLTLPPPSSLLLLLSSSLYPPSSSFTSSSHFPSFLLLLLLLLFPCNFLQLYQLYLNFLGYKRALFLFTSLLLPSSLLLSLSLLLLPRQAKNQTHFTRNKYQEKLQKNHQPKPRPSSSK